MTKHEMALNKNDLVSYFKGDTKLNSMVPGVNLAINTGPNSKI